MLSTNIPNPSFSLLYRESCCFKSNFRIVSSFLSRGQIPSKQVQVIFPSEVWGPIVPRIEVSCPATVPASLMRGHRDCPEPYGASLMRDRRSHHARPTGSLHPPARCETLSLVKRNVRTQRRRAGVLIWRVPDGQLGNVFYVFTRGC